MADKKDTNNKVEEPTKEAPVNLIREDEEVELIKQKQIFNFPTAGVSIEAGSLEEAQEIYSKTLKENKESDNG